MAKANGRMSQNHFEDNWALIHEMALRICKTQLEWLCVSFQLLVACLDWVLDVALGELYCHPAVGRVLRISQSGPQSKCPSCLA